MQCTLRECARGAYAKIEAQSRCGGHSNATHTRSNRNPINGFLMRSETDLRVRVQLSIHALHLKRTDLILWFYCSFVVDLCANVISIWSVCDCLNHLDDCAVITLDHSTGLIDRKLRLRHQCANVMSKLFDCIKIKCRLVYALRWAIRILNSELFIVTTTHRSLKKDFSSSS